MEYPIDVHFGKQSAFVVDLASRNLLQFGYQFGSAATSMGLHNADNNVFAAAATPNAFAEHTESLAYTRSVSEKHLESAALLLRFAGQ